MVERASETIAVLERTARTHWELAACYAAMGKQAAAHEAGLYHRAPARPSWRRWQCQAVEGDRPPHFRLATVENCHSIQLRQT
jgi:hypothetical protein